MGDKSIKNRDWSGAIGKFYEEKNKKKIKKTQKSLDELDPMKPIPGGGFAPIGKPIAFKKDDEV